MELVVATNLKDLEIPNIAVVLLTETKAVEVEHQVILVMVALNQVELINLAELVVEVAVVLPLVFQLMHIVELVLALVVVELVIMEKAQVELVVFMTQVLPQIDMGVVEVPQVPLTHKTLPINTLVPQHPEQQMAAVAVAAVPGMVGALVQELLQAHMVP